MKNTRIVITGIGVISSIGHGKEAFWKNLLAGKSGVSDIELFDTSRHLTHKGCEIKKFYPQDFISQEASAKYGRCSQLAMSATKLALEDANLLNEKLRDKFTALSIGTTLGEMAIIEQINYLKYIEKREDSLLPPKLPFTNLVSSVFDEFSLKGRTRIFTTACSAGNYAIIDGYDILKKGEADFVIAGGADPFSYIAFTGFNQLRAVAPEMCQPFDKNRRGMMVGEGSGMLVLETMDSAIRRNANIYAEVIGGGISCDAYHMTHTQSSGIYDAMSEALMSANISYKDVDYICAHGTGTKYNDLAESKAIIDLFKDHKPLVSSIKSMLGHTMGAASAIGAISCALALKAGVVPPTINFEVKDPDCDIDCVPNVAREGNYNIVINNGAAFGGNNASVVLRKIN